MDEKQEQAVVTETDIPATPKPEAQDARTGDDLDSLLAQYEAEAMTPEPAPATPGNAGTAPDPQIERIAEVEQKLALLESREDINKLISDVRGPDLDPEVFDDGLVESYLDYMAKRDPRLTQAWLNRRSNPTQFEKVKAELGRSFTEKFSKLPDKAATEDHEAVAAAVRGASSKTPEGKAPDYSGKSDQEFAAEVEKEFGFRPL